MQYTDKEKNVIRAIGDFFFYDESEKEKAKHPELHNDLTKELTEALKKEVQEEYFNCYNNTHKRIHDLKITRIEWNDATKEVAITLHRPGVLIGRRGEDIEKLTKYLKRNVHDKVKIKVIEDHLENYLYPIDLSDYY